MESLVKNNSSQSGSDKKTVNLRILRNNLPNNLPPRQNFSNARPIVSSSPVDQERDSNLSSRDLPRHSEINLRRENGHNYRQEILPTENVEEKVSKKTRTLFSIALFFLIAIFVAVIGWYEFWNNDANDLQKKLSQNAATASKADTLAAQAKTSAASTATAPKTAQNPAIQNSPVTTPTNTENTDVGATAADSGSTSTYKNDKEGISFDYSSEYKIEENNGQIVASKTDTMWRMKIYDNKDKKEIKEWFDAYFPKDNADCALSDPATLKIGSLATKQMKSSATDGKCDGVGFYASNSDKSKVVRIRLDKADETEANKILSTFKFVR